MGPPVLLITAFVSLLAERPDFAVAGGFHSRGRHSKVLQIALDAASPLVSQHQVVRLRATLVAVSFNDVSLGESRYSVQWAYKLPSWAYTTAMVVA